MQRAASALLLAALLAATPAQAQKSADTLRVVWRTVIPDLDPYYNAVQTGFVLAHQVWDCLVDRDPETLQIKPLLASSWRWADDTTLEFTLRQGVTFHDGSPFTADDVVYTVNTVLADPNVAVPGNYAYLDGAEKVDDFKVRLKLKRVFPAALEYVAMTLPIWPKAYRERVGAAAFAQAPVGTGPYRITGVVAGTEIDLERFDDYFPAGPKGRPAIRKVVISEVPDAATEVSLLLSGQADWIWNFDPEQFDSLIRTPGVQAMRADSMRIAYLQLDAAGRSGADNPFTREKVRQAVGYAIDRDRLLRPLTPSGARTLDAPCFPTQFGCDTAQAMRYPFNPDRARKLLAEAGYPDGFDTTLFSFELPQRAAAIQEYLHDVGIEARLMRLPQGGLVESEPYPMFLGSWSSFGINDVSAILPRFFGGGPSDFAQDAQVQSLVAAAMASTDVDQRRKTYADAIRLITSRALWLPLYTYATTYGFSRSLSFRPTRDELPLFYEMAWK